MTDAEPISELIGRSFRRLRQDEDMTLEEVARGMRSLGFRWSTPRVVELEAGRVVPTLGLLLGILHVLSENAEKAFRLVDLIPGDALVELSPGVVTTSDAVRGALQDGNPLVTQAEITRKMAALQDIRAGTSAWLRGNRWSEDNMARTAISFGLADERAARSMRIPLSDFLTIATSLWGKSLSEERLDRAPEHANAQALGRVTRLLLDEAREYYTRVKSERNDA